MSRILLTEPSLGGMTQEQRLEWYKKEVEERLNTIGITINDLTEYEQKELQEEYEAVKDGNVYLHRVLGRPEIIYRVSE